MNSHTTSKTGNRRLIISLTYFYELTVRQTDASLEPARTLWSKKSHQNVLCSSGDMANFAQVDARAAQNPAETAWTNPNIAKDIFLAVKSTLRLQTRYLPGILSAAERDWVEKEIEKESRGNIMKGKKT